MDEPAAKGTSQTGTQARTAQGVSVQTRTDGGWLLRSDAPLDSYPVRLSDCLAHWAAVAPRRVLAAQRDAEGRWRSVTYAEMLARARRVGAALLTRGLGAERPVAILSGNGLGHLTLALGALWAGVPYASVSPAYSLLSRDFERLRHVMATLTPGLVYVESAAAFAPALAACVPADVEVVAEGVAEAGAPRGRALTPWEALLAQEPGAAHWAAHEAVGADTVAKFLFTSGSTRWPKAVTHTHRMLCSNQQMMRQALAEWLTEPPVLVDWLPWNHTFGGNHNVGLVLYNGGTLYIDEGRPTAAGVADTARNLREITPTLYFNVPKGFEELAAVLDTDPALCGTLFGRCRALFYAGAALSQAVWDRLDGLSRRTCGRPVRMITGFGMTETSPSCTYALRVDLRAGHIGVPNPGVEAKLVPMDGKLELRFRGPHVMPGYWREPALSRAALDDEGFYRTGDAVRFVQADAPERGLLFDGRLAEDFKLSTGTFVSVGPLRARVVLAGAPHVADCVVTAPGRNEVGVLLFPQAEACRVLSGLPEGASLAQVLASPPLLQRLQHLVDTLAAQGGGSASRVTRAAWLTQPPSIDRGEITDKGSINQRAVLEGRAAAVQALYDGGEGVAVARYRVAQGGQDRAD